MMKSVNNPKLSCGNMCELFQNFVICVDGFIFNTMFYMNVLAFEVRETLWIVRTRAAMGI